MCMFIYVCVCEEESVSFLMFVCFLDEGIVIKRSPNREGAATFHGRLGLIKYDS